MPPRLKQAHKQSELQLPPKKDKGKAREVIDVDSPTEAASVTSERTEDISDWNESLSKELTFNQMIRAICDFMETAIHMILYVRKIYPENIFVRRQRYRAPVWQSMSPDLNKYITGAMKAIYDEIIAQQPVQKVVLVLKNGHDVAMERFIFSIHQMISLESWNRNQKIRGSTLPSQLGQYFRTFLTKLSMMESALGESEIRDNEDATFSIIVEMKDQARPKISKEKELPPWIPATAEHTTRGAHKDAQLHVVRAVDTGVINLSLSVQETKDKLTRQEVRKQRENEIGYGYHDSDAISASPDERPDRFFQPNF